MHKVKFEKPLSFGDWVMKEVCGMIAQKVVDIILRLPELGPIAVQNDVSLEELIMCAIEQGFIGGKDARNAS